MSQAVCRSVIIRNISTLNFSSTSSSTYSTTLLVTRITNGLSLMIFIVALIGNIGALGMMCALNRSLRMANRTYLINLALADLLRTCLIPFTIIPRMQRNFSFGNALCQILPILQGLSVAVEAFTLISISIERYLALCQPFLTMRLRSIRFSSAIHGLSLFLIWLLAFLSALPNFSMHHLCLLPTLQTFKCEKIPSNYVDERLYMILIDVLYLLSPIIIMMFLHTLMICKMAKKIPGAEIKSRQNEIRTTNDSYLLNVNTGASIHTVSQLTNSSSRQGSRDNFSSARSKSDRRKASKLLIVLIIEFIICWTPLYFYHTLCTFNSTTYRSFPSWIADLSLLLSFLSASCNPITYYFMSRRYRSILSFTWKRLRSRNIRSPYNLRTEKPNFIVVQLLVIGGHKKVLLNRSIKSNPM